MDHSLWRSMDGKAKVSKASVNYRRADGKRRCGSCDMFHPASPLIGSCDLVAGVIDTQDYCKEWTPTGTARALRNEKYQDLKEPATEDPAAPKGG